MSALLEAIKEFFQIIFPKRDPPGMERPSPQDWVYADEISYDQTEGIIKIDLKPLAKRLGLSQNPGLARDFIPDTNSMDGVFDYGNNTLPIYGATPEDHAKLVNALEMGSDAIYQKDDGGVIIHRVWIKKEDGLRTFAGVNNSGIMDKPDVRPDQIKYISLGVID